MPKFGQKTVGSHAFIRPWGADNNYNASYLNGYTLYSRSRNL